MDSAAHSFLHHSRLVRRLIEFDVVNFQASQEPFSERFGQLFDLSGTVILSEILGDLSAVAPNPTTVTFEAVTEEFLKRRTDLVHYIAKRFSPGGTHGKGKLPSPEEFHAHCAFTDVYASASLELSNNHSAAFEPFGDCYVALQGWLAGKIHHLHDQIRDAISGVCPQLAQLATLDKAMGQALVGQHRQRFNVIPKLLGKRFGKLFDEHLSELPGKPLVRDVERWMGAGGWLSTFCREMQEMLLSEIEVRLQPTLGLIDALSEATFGERLSNGPYE